MSPKTKSLSKQNRPDETAQRVDPPVAGETVITLATSADRHRLRNELLRLILKSESRRKSPRGYPQPTGHSQEVTTTDGSANSPTETAKA